MLTTSRPFVRRTYDEHSPLFSNFDPIVRRILLSRGVRDESELDLSLHSLLHCDDLKDIDKACEILFQALCGQSRIVVVGDYDVDGATSTTLAIRALREFGFKNVDFFIPDRVVLGYGLSEKIVSIIHEEKKAELIITVDNGITSFDGVQRARELGIRVLVTDHHLSLARLPPARLFLKSMKIMYTREGLFSMSCLHSGLICATAAGLLNTIFRFRICPGSWIWLP